MKGPLGNLYRMANCRTKRISSYDHSGDNADNRPIEPHGTLVLAEMKGAGIIRHIWCTISAKDPMYLRKLVLRMYWNGEENPSVESPIGDFFGQGWGQEYLFNSLPLAAAPGGGKALNCYFPMPFLDGARITVENQSDERVDAFYYYVDYEEHDELPDDTAMFHAWWNREITEPDGDLDENEWGSFGPNRKHPSVEGNYLFADIEGKGHFVGINYYCDCPTTIWYGEGDDMWLIDGEEWPGSLHGTGTEDCFNTAWSPKETFQHPYFGLAKASWKTGYLGRYHNYRFYIEDPIYFEKSLHSSIEHGHANCLTLDLSSVAYWYQTEPHKPFPVLPEPEKRMNMPDIDLWQIHQWRGAWRKMMGGKPWGNEPMK